MSVPRHRVLTRMPSSAPPVGRPAVTTPAPGPVRLGGSGSAVPPDSVPSPPDLSDDDDDGSDERPAAKKKGTDYDNMFL
jgi:hypothetical protein